MCVTYYFNFLTIFNSLYPLLNTLVLPNFNASIIPLNGLVSCKNLTTLDCYNVSNISNNDIYDAFKSIPELRTLIVKFDYKIPDDMNLQLCKITSHYVHVRNSLQIFISLGSCFQ